MAHHRNKRPRLFAEQSNPPCRVDLHLMETGRPRCTVLRTFRWEVPLQGGSHASLDPHLFPDQSDCTPFKQQRVSLKPESNVRTFQVPFRPSLWGLAARAARVAPCSCSSAQPKSGCKRWPLVILTGRYQDYDQQLGVVVEWHGKLQYAV